MSEEHFFTPAEAERLLLEKFGVDYSFGVSGDKVQSIHFAIVINHIEALAERVKQDQIVELAKMFLDPRIEYQELGFKALFNIIPLLPPRDEPEFLKAVLGHPNCDDHILSDLVDEVRKFRNPDAKQFVRGLTQYETAADALAALDAASLDWTL
jgi:hypothetical protein